MKFAAFALLALLAFAAVAFASQDQALDIMAFDDVEAVPRLLAEVLTTGMDPTTTGYGDSTTGAYGDRVITPDAAAPAASGIPTTQVPAGAARPSSSAATASAGMLSFFAAVVALAMF